jgi:radical SAM protein with 4Fe4S-binding SPASM domain
MDGAFAKSLAGVQLLVRCGVKVGLRFTMTALNADELPGLLALMRELDAPKFYFSHLNYAGRGNIHRGRDAHFAATRDALDRLFDAAWLDATRALGSPGDAESRSVEYVTGNNDADGVYLLLWARRHLPRWADALQARLESWGGNASGLHVANIDNLGHVHPDTMWWHHDLGSVRERPFSQIWADTSEPLMAGLKQQPRPVTGRCGACAHLAICGGNTRVRAQQVTGDPWAEDPGCYLDDAEIGLAAGAGDAARVKTTPFRERLRVVPC